MFAIDDENGAYPNTSPKKKNVCNENITNTKNPIKSIVDRCMEYPSHGAYRCRDHMNVNIPMMTPDRPRKIGPPIRYCEVFETTPMVMIAMRNFPGFIRDSI